MKKCCLWIQFLITFSFFFPIVIHAEEASTKFSLESNSFLDAGALPVLYTCDGKDVPPQISFKNVPQKSKYLAFIVYDNKDIKQAKYHWIILNIPSTTKELHEATEKLPSEAHLVRNSFNKTDYVGPCPDRGSAHEYFFTAFAYAEPLNDHDHDVGKIIEELEDKGIEASISGVYSRWFE